MKLILAILRDNDNDPVSQALIAAGFRVTRIASTGGFIRRGSTTIMVGLDEAQIEGAIQIIRQASSTPESPGGARATLFVLDVAEFTQV